MEKMLTMTPCRLARCDSKKQEEAPISGEYVLPEYCPDVATILKCYAYPRLQNRQWSGDQLMVDGIAVVRVVYADEQRQCVRTVEFAQPFTCSIRGLHQTEDTSVEIALSTKYLTCRAVSPRRIEVRGSVLVIAATECAVVKEMAVPNNMDGFYTRQEQIPITVPGRRWEKIISVNESFEFDQSLPPAERLLGGECCAVIKECKLLTGKAIIKGVLYVHQLYTDIASGNHTHCLNYAVPFSQILDASDAADGLPYRVSVQVMSDSERCSIGPDGENTILDVTAKLLLQLQVYQKAEISLLYDAYHAVCPVEMKREEVICHILYGQRYEEKKCSVSMTAPIQQWREVLDISAQIVDYHCETQDGNALLKGRIQIGVIVRDVDGEICYHECAEHFSTECACSGNQAKMEPTITAVHYRASDDALECVVALHIAVTDENVYHRQVISDLHLCSDRPFSAPKSNALLYYAETGETVWDIARACHTSPQDIIDENNLCGEEIAEKTILLIPVS